MTAPECRRFTKKAQPVNKFRSGHRSGMNLMHDCAWVGIATSWAESTRRKCRAQSHGYKQAYTQAHTSICTYTFQWWSKIRRKYTFQQTLKRMRRCIFTCKRTHRDKYARIRRKDNCAGASIRLHDWSTCDAHVTSNDSWSRNEIRLYDRNTCVAHRILPLRHRDPTLSACEIKTHTHTAKMHAKGSQNARKGPSKGTQRAAKIQAHLRNNILPRLLDQICFSLSVHLLYYHAQLFPHSDFQSYPSSVSSRIPDFPFLSLSAWQMLRTVLIFAPYLFYRILFPQFLSLLCIRLFGSI